MLTDHERALLSAARPQAEAGTQTLTAVIEAVDRFFFQLADRPMRESTIGKLYGTDAIAVARLVREALSQTGER